MDFPALFLFLLLICLFETSASVLEEIPNSFLLASSLNMFSFTMLIVITPFGVELLEDTTKVFQLSCKELNKSKACTSSFSSSFMVDNSFNGP